VWAHARGCSGTDRVVSEQGMEVEWRLHLRGRATDDNTYQAPQVKSAEMPPTALSGSAASEG
jgi:hypothetical protein